MVDLDGDGLADVLITADAAFTWYPSLGLDGFGDGRRTFPADPWSEERYSSQETRAMQQMRAEAARKLRGR